MKIKFIETVKSFCKDESGASMVEYGVALLVVSAIGVTAMTTLGGGVSANVTTACTAIGVTC
ncbi:Flp family type IVb pilin [Pseudohalocynthiibacter sp. F2068]|jgi:Flp pilus assembly pilin Flp|uniref:Flp family type IVb pilin n=1 Tax=Pseudohalocynthiibacter sp. F2068 TaxID=2926418 RepID=UPI001FF21B77|nr:Flp family type IVb pilin [Pseudohalocynthiibacter sp. F2068]MCK0104209.1 Flp family type IVb pilin [Pseudohalocynthiibacter sp. F2068]